MFFGMSSEKRKQSIAMKDTGIHTDIHTSLEEGMKHESE